MWELDYTESWAPKNLCFWTVVLEKSLESPLDSKEIQPVHPKGVQSWVFIGKTDVETETPILWPPDMKRWLTWQDPDAGKDWGQEEKGTTEDEMVSWHHRPMDMGLGEQQMLVKDREACRAAFHGVTKSRTWLSDWIDWLIVLPRWHSGKRICLPMQGIQEMQVQSLHWDREDPLEEEMTTHSSILAWRIPWKEEPGRLQSIGSQRVGHNWRELAGTHA